jgi:hypothetical protein
MFCQNNKPDIFAYVSVPRVLMLVYYSIEQDSAFCVYESWYSNIFDYIKGTVKKI